VDEKIVDYTIVVANSVEKGNALEEAVSAIESLILSTSPALQEKRFVSQSKKIIAVERVHHEIDIFVAIDLGDGYQSVFIFECKNWQDAAGKNEIIVFAEKIAATQAQYGFFVAKSFTKDAEAQAATNPRIRIVLASEHERTTAPLPLGFHQLIITPLSADATFQTRGGGSNLKTIDMVSATVKLRDEPIDLRAYLCKCAEEFASHDANSFQSRSVPEGDYERAVKARRVFQEGELTIDGKDMDFLESNIRYRATVVRPAIVSYFEVHTRGRVVSFAPTQVPSGPELALKLVWR
jgi:Restriction endonuclease